ncbi:MAG: tRNA pseudouridine(38-40) synthase TruA [Clostridia bacterium]|nr:tRNA pseudouridine(38-40) synthase TruA [Clostridia bacterium]
MPNVLLTIRYDGSAYHGWQVQKNALSIQQVLQDAIEKVFGSRLDVKGCSRTDTGVHANMYCVNFAAPFFPGDYHLISALNRHLPPDIKAYACQEVEEDFHARYCASGKEYIYYIYNAKYENPFFSKYAFHYPFAIDENRLDAAAKHLIGTHDFAAFCSANSDIEDTHRTIYNCAVVREGDMVKIIISGDGFLYNMVRIIAGTLIDVAKGKIEPEDIIDIIESKNRKNAGKTLAAKGLFLNKVFYGD